MQEDNSIYVNFFISWFPLLLVLIFWLVPLVVIGKSKRVGRKEKAIWLFATFFVSWASFMLYLIIAPVMQNDD
ncbi:MULTISPECIES: hypothetical protein [Shewanella]|uniref:hypothetical protein n=1 Tax=Shewanella TaxID=22 RepID=UPI001EFD12B4|nr:MULTISPECIES: hypothetical protein [Shewanella]MCG9748302.1 hypothetical protein [Shewanella sp. Isolate8]MCL2911487.1 hypothetical protein [Shewanella aquimarina]